ncbi:MAG: L,D-transpeptidase [Gemmatimonadaceae bacterium]|nr:L,D-transpeptidase [Gemmatimonadaceae bacterium]
MPLNRFLSYGGKTVWALLLGFVVASALSTTLLAKTAELRYKRDVNRMVYNDNLGVLKEVKAKMGETSDRLNTLLSDTTSTVANRAYIVVSIEEHTIWYKQGDSVLFQAGVATGSGKSMVSEAGGQQYKFDTPRGRLVVQDKEVDPAWVPPDWHFLEQSRKRGLGMVKMERGQSIQTSDGAVVSVSGSDVVKRYPNGSTVALAAEDGREIVVNGNIIVPPYGVNQRRYKGVLGTRRLVLGDGYGIHGTNQPSSIGRSVSHGCVRMRNEDIEKLFEMVPVGTPVFIY